MTKRAALSPPTLGRRAGVAAFDALAGAGAMAGAILVRAPNPDPETIALVSGAFAVCVIVGFGLLKVWSAFWRYTSLGDLFDLARGVAAANVIFVPAWFFVTRLDGVPRSSILIEGALFFGLTACARLLTRWIRTERLSFNRISASARTDVIVAGPTDKIDPFIRAVHGDPTTRLRITGAIGLQSDHKGRRIRGVPVLGGPSDAAGVLSGLHARGEKPDALILLGEHLDPRHSAALVAAAADAGVRTARAQMPDELLKAGHGGALTPLRLTDLLGRPPRRLDASPVRELVRDRCIMVTGAGGSIGGALVRRIAAFGPAAVVLVDHSEAGLYAIDLEMRERGIEDLRPLILDIRDRDAVGAACMRHRPHVVFHAAALKHVPLMEAQPREAILTNILGTMNAADAAEMAGAAAFVLISTDKAVRPANVMGATKRAAELYVQAKDAASTKTRFGAVRFGNVLGSAGSVVPLFERQLARGGPLTVTHPDMRRYFMTAEEAGALTLQAAAAASQSTTRGRIHVLDMGEPVRILDLAHQMIRLRGLRPDADVKVDFTGLRPGERLMEELTWGEDAPQRTEVDGLLESQPPFPSLTALRPTLDGLIAAARGRNDPTAALFELIGDAFDADASAASKARTNVVPIPRRA